MIIDLHCDTFSRMYYDKLEAKDIEKNNLHIDLEKLKKGDVLAQCFAIFNDKKTGEEYDTELMYKKIDYMFKGLNMFPEGIYLYKGYDDLISNFGKGKICAIPTIEDLGPIMGDISHIDRLHEMGFKILSLTWNHENTMAYPNSQDESIMSRGIKKFGAEVIERMNELNIIVDVSHLSDGGFYDVAKISKKPFVATHSNARSEANHPRNLTDDMIKILSDAGGVTGINFLSLFLLEDSKVSRVDDMVRHIKHIKNVGGIDCIAMGSDFDGISCELEIEDASQHYKLIEALDAAGFTTGEIEKITYKNMLRVFKDSE